MHASLDPLVPSHRLPAFFLLVFALSTPFWLIGGATDLQLMPAVSLVVYGLMHWQDAPLPTAQFHLIFALFMFIAFYLEGLGEELSWSGYAVVVKLFRTAR